MSFFKKLKERLVKSSSKLEAGIDDLIPQDTAAEDISDEQPVKTSPVGNAHAVQDTPAEPADAPAPLEQQAEVATGVDEPSVEPEEEPKTATAQEPLSAPAIEPELQPEPVKPTEPEKPKAGLLSRLIGRASSISAPRRAVDDALLEELEELLILSDMGVDTAMSISAAIADKHFGARLSAADIKAALAREIAAILAPTAKPFPIYPHKPQVVLVVGVNGAGKTTTIGKLASQFKAAGKSVMIAAGDTFRAAAVEQLQVWGDRAGVPVLTAPEGSDPASLAYDAMARATAEGADLLLIDTAGRLQNRTDLMDELAKIMRVLRKQDESAPHNTLLVLDATTGQNAISQVDVFKQISNVSGLIMTKLDGTAKGGILVALAARFGLPIHAIGVGEKIEDLDAFDAEEFAAAITGLDASDKAQ